MLSLAWYIPLELAGEIATLLFSGSTLGKNERKALVNAGLVCKRWRQGTLLKHQLWSGVRVGEGQLGSYQKVVAWISRAGNLPKTLNFADEIEYDEEECETKECLGNPECMQHNPTLIKLLTEGPTLDSGGLSSMTPECLQHVKRTIGRLGMKGQGPWYIWGRLGAAIRVQHLDVSREVVHGNIPDIHQVKRPQRHGTTGYACHSFPPSRTLSVADTSDSWQILILPAATGRRRDLPV